MMSSFEKIKNAATSRLCPSNIISSEDKKHISKAFTNPSTSDYFTNPSNTDYSATNTGSANTTNMEHEGRDPNQPTTRPTVSSS